MNKEETPKKGNNFINIIITEALCVVIILLSLLVVKYFFKGEYKELKGWYTNQVATNTDINEVLQ